MKKLIIMLAVMIKRSNAKYVIKFLLAEHNVGNHAQQAANMAFIALIDNGFSYTDSIKKAVECGIKVQESLSYSGAK